MHRFSAEKKSPSVMETEIYCSVWRNPHENVIGSIVIFPRERQFVFPIPASAIALYGISGCNIKCNFHQWKCKSMEWKNDDALIIPCPVAGVHPLSLAAPPTLCHFVSLGRPNAMNIFQP